MTEDLVRRVLAKREAAEAEVRRFNHMLAIAGYREDEAGTMGGGEDATAHEWNFGHPFKGIDETCFTCQDRVTTRKCGSCQKPGHYAGDNKHACVYGGKEINS